jgi:hypothetical protein
MIILRPLGRIFASAVLGIVFAVLAWGPANAQDEAKITAKFPKTVLIIRHAEKTGDKEDIHLSEPGKQRAEVLHQLFEPSKDRANPFPKPDFIFAAAHHKDSQRPLETITPSATRWKMSINNSFDSKLPPPDADKKNAKLNMHNLRDEIFGDSKYFGKTILICWRHSTLPELAKTFKASKVPEKWDDNIFDRVWLISYDDEGAAKFEDLPQRLIKGDSAK